MLENIIMLENIMISNPKEFEKIKKAIAKEGRKRAEKLRIKESDIPKIVHRLRGIKG